jgi:hypothetical protein
MSDSQHPDFILVWQPLNPMQTMANEAHQLFQAYMTAGFTRLEAFDLLLNQLPEWDFPGHRTVPLDDEEDDEEDDESSPDEMDEDG